MKEAIYFPSLSTDYGSFKNHKKLINDLTYRYFTDEYGKFKHPYLLLTAGSLYKKKTARLDAGLENTLIFGDSGGFQIATGALKSYPGLKEEIFEWLENNSDIAMQLDFPPHSFPDSQFQECLDKTKTNVEWFYENQTGKTNFINVWQNKNDAQTENWYNTLKDYKFNGWGVAGRKITINSIAKMIIALKKDKDFERKEFKWWHFLGKTSIYHFFIYGVLQKNMNLHYPHITVTTDSSSPSMSAVFGSFYHSINYKNLSFSTIWFPPGDNKKGIIYEKDEQIPCTIDCPVCSEITFKNVAEGRYGHVKGLMSYHNLQMLIKASKDTNKLCASHFELLEGLIPRDFYLALKSLNDLFAADLHDLEKIYHRNLPIYKRVDDLFSDPEKEELIDTSLFA